MAAVLHPNFPSRNDALTSSLTSGNMLLKELLSIPSVGDYLLPKLNLVSLSLNQVLYENGDQIEYVYFPVDSVISQLAIMEDGSTVETAMVGREGMLGISAILGSGRAQQSLWATVNGNALVLKSKFLDDVFLNNRSALKLLLGCYRSLITQISQRCLCNTRHTILDRLSCWLLMLNDRIGESTLNLTQETIASRVAARRAGITVAAGILQEINAIAYTRGRVQIKSREALLRNVCECYNTMQIASEPATASLQQFQ